MLLSTLCHGIRVMRRIAELWHSSVACNALLTVACAHAAVATRSTALPRAAVVTLHNLNAPPTVPLPH
jgi:hypothetical protein